MTPLQKGMAKAYFKFFRSLSILMVAYLYFNWSDVNGRKNYIIIWICMPIIAAYDYYLRNRKKEKNKSVSHWVDALKLFMVCLLIFAAIFIFPVNKHDSDWFGLYFSIPLSIIFSGIFSFGYFWDIRKNKK